MDILDTIYEKIRKHNGSTPRKIVLSRHAHDMLKLEINSEYVYSLYGLTIEIAKFKGDNDIIITNERCSDNESLRTKCTECECLSYENGYCPECGLYRGDDEYSEDDDLCELISDQNESLVYGFGLME